MSQKSFRFFCLLIGFTAFSIATNRSAGDEDLKNDIAAQVKAARAILDPWHAQDPQTAERYLHIVYWTPSDREPAPKYQERITRFLKHIQEFYGKEMKRLGFGERSIKLQFDEEGQVIIHFVKGAGPYADYNVQSGGKIRTECLPTLKEAGIDPNRETLVIFCNMAEWDDEKKIFKHRSPYYAGGSAKSGTAWQLDSPILDSKNLALKEPKMRDGQYGHISIGKHNSIFIGGVAHELGHGLGLPHNKERADERAAFGTALMGSGNRTYGDELRGEGKGSFLTLAHGLRLASHPQFSGSVKGLNRPVRAKFTDIEVSSAATSFSIKGKVDSDTPVYAVIGYMDPDGGSDYNATTTSAIPDKEGNFALDCSALVPGKSASLNLVACHVNGAVSKRSFRYSVDKAGKPDLTLTQTRLALAPLLEAVSSRAKPDGPEIAAAMTHLHKHASGEPGGLPHRIAKRLVVSGSRERAFPKPAEIQEGVKTVALGDSTSDSAKVGWHMPFVDRTPPPGMLLGAGGKLFEHGLYAHAPAEHKFNLGKKWKTLTGTCGVADSSSGSVVFVILGDGKELWRSPTTKTGKLHQFELDVSDTENLTLVVEDAGDTNRSDWGLWLEPTLSR